MLTLALLGVLMTSTQLEEQFYIGTYTSPDGSKGIYRATLNLQTGQLSPATLAAETYAPSFIAFNSTGKNLYTIDENSGGEVSAYSVSADGALALLNKQTWNGIAACHLSVAPSNKDLLIACYGDGSIADFPLTPSGQLKPLSHRFQNTGSGPNKGRQEGPHLHSIYPGTKQRFAYACDLGTDEVLIFPLSPGVSAEPHRHKVAPGSGPRHIAFHPSGKWLYVNMELSNQVAAMAIDAKSGELHELQSVPTLPTDRASRPNTTSEIACHKSGKWLYVSNRGDDSIAAYEIAKDGKLTTLQIISAGVHEPRGFALDHSGKWLVVAGQNSNDIMSFSIDGITGKLSPSGSTIHVPTPVCVVFRP